MTISTNTLLPQPGASVEQTQHQRSSATQHSDGVSFNATLTRQLEQRQLAQRQRDNLRAQPPATPAQPAAPAPVAPPVQHDRPGTASASQSTAPQSAPPAQPAAPSEQRTPAADNASKDSKDSDASEDDSRSADARTADAVVDMLALVASLQQPTPSPAALNHTLALRSATSGKAGAGAADAADDSGASTSTSTSLRAAFTRDSAPALQGASDPRAADPSLSGATPGAARADSDFGAQLRASVHSSVGAKESIPDSAALASIPTQTGTLQSAQALAAVVPDRLSARVGSAAWDQQVGQKVVWMVGGADQSATLELNPPDLGPLQVVLTVSNDSANVSFSAPQLEVRQALENALPRLREMLQESGIALGNASVNGGNDGRQGQADQGGQRRAAGASGDGTDDGGERAPRQRSSSIGGAGAVDTFA